MKPKNFLSIVLAGSILCFSAFTHKSKKATYAFPPEMSEGVKTEYKKLCDRGQILYELNCARCHNVKVKGKWVVPDFTKDQVNGYEIRVGNRAHENSLSDEAITSEEIGLIATFLMYKEPGGGQVADAFGGKLTPKEEE